MGKRIEFTEEQITLLKEYITNPKLTYAELANKLGVSERTIYRQLKKYNLSRQHHAISPDTILNIAIAYAECKINEVELYYKLKPLCDNIYLRHVRHKYDPNFKPPEDIKRIIDEYNGRISSTDLADKAKISKTRAYTILRRMGFTQSPAESNRTNLEQRLSCEKVKNNPEVLEIISKYRKIIGSNNSSK